MPATRHADGYLPPRWALHLVLVTVPLFAAAWAHAESPVPDAASRMKLSVWSPPTSVTAEPSPDLARADLPTVIENGQVRLRFKSADRGSGLGSLVFVPSGREALATVDDRPKWWQIDVRTSAGKIFSVSNLSAPPARFVAAADRSTGGRFEWASVPVSGVEGWLDVVVSLRLVPGSSLARVRIEVTNYLDQASLWDVAFPYVNHLGYPGQSDVLVPSTFSMMAHGELLRGAKGRLYPSYLGAPYVDYPGGGFPIGHMSCTIGAGTVVYIGCHDPGGSTKGYGWTIEEGLRFHVPPPNMSAPGVNYRQDWDFVIGPIEGDWFDAALVYREWATRQFWCSKGRLSARTDLPRALIEVPYWGDPQWPGAGYRDEEFSIDAKAASIDKQFQPAAGRFKPEERAYDVQSREMLRRNELAIQTYGLPLGIQWYGWHRARFDGNYPEYFPSRPGFAQALQNQARPDLYVHGFLNGLWVDRSVPEFLKAAPWAIVDLDTFQKQAQGPLDPLKLRAGEALICPHTDYWQDTMAGFAQQMADLGFQGAYLDVLANAGGTLCLSSEHGHPTGGGNWLVTGSRKLAMRMKEPGKLTYVTSECFDEPLGQALDLFYTWNDWKDEEAPLLGAIYGGYLQWYGSGNGGGIDEAARLARTVFWGGRIGIFASADAVEGNEGIRGIVARLVALQRKTHKYLTYGQMVRPPNWKSVEPTRLLAAATADHGSLYMEGVERAAWLAPDGQVGVCLFNYLEQPVVAEFDLTTMRELVASPAPRVIEPSGKADLKASVDAGILRISVPSLLPVLVEVGTLAPRSMLQ